MKTPGVSAPTFLGVPRHRSTAPGPSPIRGEQAFPKSAKTELANPQLRANLAHATSTIRDKRALVVEEMPDWEALRASGSAIKTDVMSRLPDLLEQFETLPGVGPVTASAIIAWRNANGRFANVEQLGEVDGIGPARLAKLHDLVHV